jgi:hypothetical protein
MLTTRTSTDIISTESHSVNRWCGNWRARTERHRDRAGVCCVATTRALDIVGADTDRAGTGILA